MSKKSKESKNTVEDKDTAQTQEKTQNVNGEQNPENQETVVEEVSELDALKEDLAKEKDKFLRLFAEFENYKKRTSKERIELFKTAGQDILQAMLPVIDDFDRALVEISKSEDKEMLKGVELISSKLKNVLEGKGLEVIDTKAGDTFDAEVHDAVTQIPAPSDDLKGKIVDVIEKGYKLGDKIIRHPKVVFGQ
ncbi:nucleotide exchange factor GrpE [Zhouia amylolytica]|nr:nucleotide exchange factor GrpE [Zhouia amylolytica]